MRKLFLSFPVMLIIFFSHAQNVFSYEDINTQSVTKALKDVVYDNSGNMIATGTFYPTITFGAITLSSSNASAVYVVKRVNGTYTWGKVFTSVPGYPFGLSITYISTDASGNILLTGSLLGRGNFDNVIATSLKNGPNYCQNIVTVKMLSTGTVAWVRVDGTKHDDICTIGISEGGMGVTADAQGNIYTTGQQVARTVRSSGACNWACNRTGTTTAGVACMYLVKYGPDGTKKWEKKYSNPLATGNYCGQGTTGWSLESDGTNVYMLGHYYGQVTIGNVTLNTGAENISNIVLAKYDGNGNVLWVRSVTNGPSHIFGVGDNMMLDVSNNAIYFNGIFNGSGPISFGTCSTPLTGQHGFMVKCNLSGDCSWVVPVAGINVGIVKYPNNNIGTMVRTGTSVGQDTFDIREVSSSDGATLSSITTQFTPTARLNGYFKIVPAPNGFVIPMNLAGSMNFGSVTVSSTQPLESSYADMILVYSSTSTPPIARRGNIITEIANNKIILYPNPANNQITIRNNDNRSLGMVCIYDGSGKMIYQKSFGSPQTMIDVKNFSAGIYYLRSDQLQATIKFVKQ